MINRRGFTLMEIMVALTITALIATVASASVRAALDVRERVQEHRLTVDAEARATTWIGTMLRHPPVPSAVNEALLTITPTVNGNSELTFLSQGVETPAGTGTIWRVTLGVRRDGMHIYVTPAGTARVRVPLETVLPHVHSLDVEALEIGNNTSVGRWRRDWPLLRAMPRALRLTMGTEPPVVFSISPLTFGAQ